MDGAQLACPFLQGMTWQSEVVPHCVGPVVYLSNIRVTSVFGESFDKNLLTELARQCEGGRWRLDLGFGLHRHVGECEVCFRMIDSWCWLGIFHAHNGTTGKRKSRRLLAFSELLFPQLPALSNEDQLIPDFLSQIACLHSKHSLCQR